MERGDGRMMLDVVIQNGVVIHFGEWDYQYDIKYDAEGVEIEREARNPLPTDSIIEQRECVQIDGVWQLVDIPKSLTQEERITELENIILTLLEVL